MQVDIKRRKNLDILMRLFALTKHYWPAYLLLFSCSFFAAPLALLAPLPLSIIADFVLGDKPIAGTWLAKLPLLVDSNQDILVFAILLLLLTSLLQQCDSYGNWLLQTYVGDRVSINLKKKFLDHLLRLPISQHRSTHSTDYLYRMQNDIPSLMYVPIQWIIMMNASISVAVMIYVIAQLNGKIALLALVVLPLIYLLLKVYEPRARKSWAQFKEMESHQFGFLKETLAVVLPLKAYGMESLRSGEANRLGLQLLLQQMRAIGVESVFGASIALLLATGSALVLYQGTADVLQQELSLGQLILIMGYLSQLYKPLETLAKKSASMQSAFASADRVLGVLDLPVDPLYTSPNRQLAKGETQGAISMRLVTFAYDNGLPIFNGLNLEIAPGTMLGITGPSGVGKSTLLHLVCGIAKPVEGEILIDGIPIQDLGAEQLSQLISVVFQDSLLVSGTIRDNITFGLAGIAESAIEQSCRDAYAHDFIHRLPLGYQTQVGEGGTKLSGGERQRIALARAFLRNSPILLLDEPTSSVDQDSEQAIVAALHKLVQGRTTLFVSHRPESLLNCTAMLALKNPKLPT